MFQNKSIEVIEGLRGLAALSVAYYHLTSAGSLVSTPWLKASGAYGWLGVHVFFVISGFVIPYSLYRSNYRLALLGRFLLKRVIRLDPLYLITIALSVALWYASAAVPGFRGAPPDVDAVQLLLHVGYLNSFFGYRWLLPVLWTLAIEFQFYILASLAVPLLAHPSAAPRLGALAAMCLLPFVVPHPALVFHYLGLFALGVVTFTTYIGLTTVRAYLVLLAPIAAATAMSVGIAEATVALATALVIAFVRLPRIGALVFLGAISYPLYLLHVPIGGRVANLGARTADTTALQIGVLIAALGASIVAAYVAYLIVDRRAKQWSSLIRYRTPT